MYGTSALDVGILVGNVQVLDLKNATIVAEALVGGAN